jgi:hypothetical protein
MDLNSGVRLYSSGIIRICSFSWPVGWLRPGISRILLKNEQMLNQKLYICKKLFMKSGLFSIEVKGNNPFVVLDLKKYQLLLEQIEDMKDRLAIRERINDEDIPWEVTEKKLKKKFGLK